MPGATWSARTISIEPPAVLTRNAREYRNPADHARPAVDINPGPAQALR
jgi:hypothetical protein